MKLSKYALAAALMFGGTAFAFHSGGVAECEGCHTMHNSFEGSPNTVSGGPAGPYLLKGTDQTSTCLGCHEGTPGSYHISTASADIAPYDSTVPTQRTAGGDFAWLKKTMTGSIRGKAAAPWDGERKGHNIVATDFGYNADLIQATAPGGSYPSTNLACSSCHDPHGRYRRDDTGAYATTGLPIVGSGSYATSAAPTSGIYAVGAYRLLAGAGYQPASLAGAFAFTADPPAAVSPNSYNTSQTTIAGAATLSDRVAYGSGMSEWCSNCHANMHSAALYTSGTPGLIHPNGATGKLTAAIATNYTDYVSSGIMTGGTPANGYSALAPFETGDDSTLAGYAALKTFQATPAVPVGGTSQVVCLSCHRAHASAFESMLRYAYHNEFMTIGDAAGVASYDSSTTENKINYGYSVAQQEAAYNGRPATLFGPWARSYCNKCHAKD